MSEENETRVEEVQAVRAAFQPSSANEESRSVDMVWTTGAEVLRFDWGAGHHFYERLRVDGDAVDLGRLNDGAPLLNTHRATELGDQIGVVERAGISGGEGRATVRFSKRDDVEPIFRDVVDGIHRNVSVGYRALRVEKTDETRDGVPIREVTRWEPRELSLVPVGADAGAQVRAEDIHLPAPSGVVRKKENEMNEEQTQERAATEAPEIKNPPTVDLDAVRAEARKAERERATGIGDAVRKAGLEPSFAAELVEKGISLDAARAAVIDAVAEKGAEEVSTISAGDTRERDGDFRKLLEDGLAMRAGLEKREGEAAHFSAMPMARFAEEFLRQRGDSVIGKSPYDICRAANLTADFSGIVAAVAGRSLRKAYDEHPSTWRQLARQTTVANFRTIERVKLGSAPALAAVAEGDAYTEAALTDGKETYVVTKFGKIIKLTIEAMVNDDLDALTRVPTMFGRAAARKESDVVWTDVVLANGNMSDGNPVFSIANANYLHGSAIADLAILGLEQAAAGLMAQTGDEGETLDLTPRHLVVGPGQQFVAERLLRDANDADASNNLAPSLRSLNLIVEPRFTSLQWLLAADSSAIDTIETAYVSGMEGVQVEMDETFNADAVSYKGRLVFGAGIIDHRGMVFSSGINS